MTEDSAPPTVPPRTGLRRFGYRNIAYLVFVAILIPAGIALEASGPRGPDSGGGIMAAVALWALGSLTFFVVNAVLAVSALAKGRPAGVPVLACALPLAIVVAMLALEEIMSAAGLL